jgi:hypothetical protein
VDESCLVLSQKWLVPNDEKQRQLRPDVRTKSSGLYDLRPGGTVHVDMKQFCDPAKVATGEIVPEILPMLIPPLLNEIVMPAKPEGERFFCEGTPPRQYEKQSVHVPKQARWSLGCSVWAKRPYESPSKTFWDTEEVVISAFDSDWKHCKLGKANQRVFKDEDTALQVREVMRKHYKVVADLMVVYGSFTPKDPFDISWNAFRELLKDCKVLVVGEKNSLRAEAVDMIFMKVNIEVGKEASALDNDDRALTRFELLEALVRIAFDKFLVPGSLVTTEADACEKLFADHLIPFAERADKDSWRDARMYFEEVSIELKSCMHELVALYRTYVTARRQQRLEVPALVEMCDAKGIFCEDFGKRDAVKAFMLSRMSTSQPTLTPPSLRPKSMHSPPTLYSLCMTCLLFSGHGRNEPTEDSNTRLPSRGQQATELSPYSQVRLRRCLPFSYYCTLCSIGVSNMWE